MRPRALSGTRMFESRPSELQDPVLLGVGRDRRDPLLRDLRDQLGLAGAEHLRGALGPFGPLGIALAQLLGERRAWRDRRTRRATRLHDVVASSTSIDAPVGEPGTASSRDAARASARSRARRRGRSWPRRGTSAARAPPARRGRGARCRSRAPRGGRAPRRAGCGPLRSARPERLHANVIAPSVWPRATSGRASAELRVELRHQLEVTRRRARSPPAARGRTARSTTGSPARSDLEAGCGESHVGE